MRLRFKLLESRELFLIELSYVLSSIKIQTDE